MVKTFVGSSLQLLYARDARFLSFVRDARFLSFLIHGVWVKMLGGGKGYLGDDFVVNFSPEFLQFELRATCNLMLVSFGFVFTHCGGNA